MKEKAEDPLEAQKQKTTKGVTLNPNISVVFIFI
jgi:hypothetical protein